MTKAIIFDLDNCLSAADEPGASLLAPVFDAIQRTNDGRFSESDLERIQFDCWRSPLDAVAQKHGFPAEMLSAAGAAYEKLEVKTAMHGYGDLDVLAELPVQKFLVTSGFRRLQESKVRALGFASDFTSIYIDAVEDPERLGKEGLFEMILRDHGLNRSEVLIVGDNPDSEIAAGNRLGIETVQILRPGVERGQNAKHFISGLRELEVFIPQQFDRESGQKFSNTGDE